MKSKTCKKALNRLNNVYRIKFSRSDPPKIARGVHEGTPLWIKQASKRQKAFSLGGSQSASRIWHTQGQKFGLRRVHVADSSGLKILFGNFAGAAS